MGREGKALWWLKTGLRGRCGEVQYVSGGEVRFCWVRSVVSLESDCGALKGYLIGDWATSFGSGIDAFDLAT